MKKLIITKENPNGEYIDMTPEEIEQNNLDVARSQEVAQQLQQAQLQKDADALAGNNKLLELGLTQAQVTAMTGYTPPVAE